MLQERSQYSVLVREGVKSRAHLSRLHRFWYDWSAAGPPVLSCQERKERQRPRNSSILRGLETSLETTARIRAAPGTWETSTVNGLVSWRMRTEFEVTKDHHPQSLEK